MSDPIPEVTIDAETLQRLKDELNARSPAKVATNIAKSMQPVPKHILISTEELASLTDGTADKKIIVEPQKP